MMSRSSPLRSTLEWLALLLFLAAPIGGSILYGGVRLWMSGPFLLTTCAASVLLLTLKFLYRESLFRLPPAWFGLLAICSFVLYAIPGASVPYEAKLEFVKWCALLLTYWGLSELLSRDDRWKIVLGLFLVAGSLLIWYAYIQHSRGSNLVLTMERPEGYGMRASSTFVCPNHFAYLLELYLVMGVAVLLLRSAGTALRLICGYTVVLALPVLLMTESRSGWIGAVAGIGTVIVLLSSRRSLVRMLVAGSLFGLAVVLIALSLWMFSPVFKQRVNEALQGNMRTEVWADTLDMIQDEPAVGYGPGSYRWIYPRYKDSYRAGEMFPRFAHNEYLHLVSEYGAAGSTIVGVALLFWLVRLLIYFRNTSSDRNAALLAGLLGTTAASAAHALFDFNLHQFGCQQSFALVAALVAGCLFENRERKPVEMNPWLASGFCAVGAIGCIALAATIAQMLYGYRLTERAEDLRENLELDQALVQADQAIRVYPTYWKAHRERAQTLRTQSFWNFDADMKHQQAEAATKSYQRVLDLNPCDTQSMIELSKLYGDQLGDQERAVTILNQTIEFAPRVFYFHSELGMRYRQAGELEKALAAFEQARKLYAGDQMTNLNIKRLKRMIRDQQAAAPAPAQDP